MFALTVAIVLISTACVYTALWCGHKREQATTNRLAGYTKRAGRHRAEDRPTMTWRG